MRRIGIAIALAAVLAMPAAASEKTDVMATVHQFVQAFNRGNARAAAAACADKTSIIDPFPPHEWNGAGACSQWMQAFGAYARKNGITDARVTLGAPRHVEVTGDRAYVVVPANYFSRQKGKRVSEIGSTFTLVLQKFPAGWRILAWAWAQH